MADLGILNGLIYGYRTIQRVGVELARRSVLNFSDAFTIVDNAATGATDISIDASPEGDAGGDLDGQYPYPDVIAIRGVAVDATPPTAGQILKATSPTTAAWSDSGQVALFEAEFYNYATLNPLVQGNNLLSDGVTWKFGAQNNALNKCMILNGTGLIFEGVGTQAGLFAKVLDLAPDLDLSRPWGVDIDFLVPGSSAFGSDCFCEIALTDYQYNTTSYDIPQTSNTNGSGLILKTAVKFAAGSATINSFYTQRWVTTTPTIIFSGGGIATPFDAGTLSIDVIGGHYSFFGGETFDRSNQRQVGDILQSANYINYANLAVEVGWGYDTNISGNRKMVCTRLRIRQ